MTPVIVLLAVLVGLQVVQALLLQSLRQELRQRVVPSRREQVADVAQRVQAGRRRWPFTEGGRP